VVASVRRVLWLAALSLPAELVDHLLESGDVLHRDESRPTGSDAPVVPIPSQPACREVPVTTLETKRWKRYGKDRVYVSDAAGQRVGWLDLLDGSQHLEMAAHAEAFTEALRPFLTADPAAPVVDEPVASPAAHVPSSGVWTDLAAHRPGQGVRAQADALRTDMAERSRVGTMLKRVLDVKTDERAHRVGANGEEAVGARLEKLVKHGWHVLHSIPVGKGKSDIDHLLIGQGGIYTVNTKNHPGKQIWVGQHLIKVDGFSTRYLPIARYETERAQRLLSQAVGFDVPAKAVLVILTGTVIPQVTIKQMPDDVLVLDRMDVPGAFKKAPHRLAPAQVEQVYAQARRSTLWR
jgi:hypothetical protein